MGLLLKSCRRERPSAAKSRHRRRSDRDAARIRRPRSLWVRPAELADRREARSPQQRWARDNGRGQPIILFGTSTKTKTAEDGPAGMIRVIWPGSIILRPANR